MIEIGENFAVPVWPEPETRYWAKVRLYIKGFKRLGAIRYKPGWDKDRFFWVYLLNVGPAVLILGAGIGPISRFAENHRSGWAWDKILDTVEAWDKDHGKNAMGYLWNTGDSPPKTRIILGFVWTIIIATIIL